MIGAVFKIMWLRLWRDKGALILAFVLPGFIFAIFAAIFANASGGSLDLRVALANESDATTSVAFADTLATSDLITVNTQSAWTQADVAQRVRLGQDDVGIVITGDLSDTTAPRILVIEDPSRQVAATVIKGQIRQQLAASGPTGPQMITTTSALPNGAEGDVKDQSVTYYIGATAILFLLFSAMQAAAISIDERRNGISDRLMLGPSGALALLSGKFAFLTLTGFVQAAIICGVAWLAFQVDIPAHIGPIALACLGASMLAAGLALLVAALCDSPSQMHTASTFIVLLVSAVGGSMVPRFMMPGWLQQASIFTPNFWSIEAFYGILARGQSVLDLMVVWCVLFGGALVALLLAAFVSHKLMRA